MFRCIICAAPVLQRRTGQRLDPSRVVCSPACRAARYRREGRGAAHAPRHAISYANCQWCARLFVVRRPADSTRPARTCRSVECRRAEAARLQRERGYSRKSRAKLGRPASTRAADARRRAILRGAATTELVSPVAVFKRDGWRCGICLEQVDQALRYPDPMSASIDHVVPLAAGGAHTMANVQCSHLGCNVRRGARGGGEQLRLVG